MYTVKFTALFKRSLKKLSKKYPKIKQDLTSLLDRLEQGIIQGDELQNLPGKVYKVRVGSSDQKRGKKRRFQGCLSHRHGNGSDSSLNYLLKGPTTRFVARTKAKA